jgi:hypothetical protein
VKCPCSSTAEEAGARAGEPERRVVSQKVRAKEKRQALYQSAKARRATDPRYLAMKEAAKAQRRAAYQKVKERRKATTADEKARRKSEHTVACAHRREESDRELMKLVTWLSKSSIPQND